MINIIKAFFSADPRKVPDLNNPTYYYYKTHTLKEEFSMSSDKVVVITDAEFDSSVLQSEKPVVLDFWAEWCQPCKMLAPTVEEVAGEYEDKIKVGKLNVDDNPSTATKYGIRGIPTLLFFKGGKVVQQVTGVKSKAEIKKIIDESLV